MTEEKKLTIKELLQLPRDDDPPPLRPLELSDKEQTVLALLGDAEAYGLDLIRRSNGKLRRGVVYVDLERMADRLLLESRMEESTPELVGSPRRLYRATPIGKRALNASRCPECRASWPYRHHKMDCSRR